jgi:hypothetical protein
MAKIAFAKTHKTCEKAMVSTVFATVLIFQKYFKKHSRDFRKEAQLVVKILSVIAGIGLSAKVIQT